MRAQAELVQTTRVTLEMNRDEAETLIAALTSYVKDARGMSQALDQECDDMIVAIQDALALRLQ